MDYNNVNLTHFARIEGKNVFQTAEEFFKFSEWSKQNKEYFFRRISTNGSEPVMSIIDTESGKSKLMVNFSGNGYLNLAKHPKVIQAGIEAMQKYGAGSESAPLLGGTFDVHTKLEDKIAELKHCDAAIIHSSGYGSNLGTLRAMLKQGDLAIIDQYSHASIADGSSQATVRIFMHSDMNSLEKILKLNASGNYQTRMICVDGVYSMDGDIAPLPDICQLAKKFGAFVYVDDAHSVGVIGKNGKGSSEYFNLEGQIDVVAGTLSKAIGSVGGFIASNHQLIEYLRYYSRAYMFSTAGTPVAAACASAAIDVILNEPDRRQRLWNNIHYLKARLLKLGFNIGNTETAIFPVIIGDNYKVKEMVKFLDKNNLYVSMVLYPAVPQELSRLRISLCQGHTQQQIDNLVDAMEIKAKELTII